MANSQNIDTFGILLHTYNPFHFGFFSFSRIDKKMKKNKKKFLGLRPEPPHLFSQLFQFYKIWQICPSDMLFVFICFF